LRSPTLCAGLLGLVVLPACQWLSDEDGAAAAAPARAPIPVEVGPVEHGAITLRRTLSGTLEAAAAFEVASKVGGRLTRLDVDLGDTVTRGQVVAHLDDDEFVQAVTQAEADLAVARADQVEASSALEIALRGLARVESLREQGVTSESQVDAAKAEELAARAHVEVTRARVTRAEASLEAARIRLGYARVTADWSGGDDQRVVAQRWVDEGETVSAGAALLSIVELDPIVGVVYVPERDYARLAVGQTARLTTDAHPGRTFEARLTRIAPVFRSSTRQARIELEVANADEALKPGMFLRAALDLERVAEATIVPHDALTERDGETGVFVLDDDARTVHWRPVTVGVREGPRVQVQAEGLAGRVVTLGQELCDDGATVRVPERVDTTGGAASPAR
jgi:RND family efflux transporter MFP subunit